MRVNALRVRSPLKSDVLRDRKRELLMQPYLELVGVDIALQNFVLEQPLLF